MRAKYGYKEDILPDLRGRRNSSNAWKGIIQIWPRFKQNLIWREEIVRIWRDHWIPGIHKTRRFYCH